MIVKRTIIQHLKKMLKQFPIVSVTGPRQSGKSTLARKMFPEKHYVSCEDPDTLLFARQDPRGFLKTYENAVIDEAQKVPEIFSYIQAVVDQRDQPGQFILTGSSDFLLFEKISQSLAGRTAVLRLLPFSLGEIFPSHPREDYEDYLFTGFYPRIYKMGIPAQDFYPGYVQTYVERDVRSVLAVRDLDRFAACVRLCATRIGQVVNAASLAGDLGVDAKTVRAWLSVLSAGYIIHLLPPHFSNFGKRITKQPKLYFLDTGLACRLLGIGDSASLRQHPSWGALVENWFIAEALKQTRHSGSSVSEWYWWRSHDGLEIDLVRDRGGQLYTCEIKASTSPGIAAKTPQRRFADIAKERWAGGALCHLGSDDGTRGMIRHIPWTHSQALAQLGE